MTIDCKSRESLTKDSILSFPDIPYASHLPCADYDRNIDVYIKRRHHPVFGDCDHPHDTEAVEHDTEAVKDGYEKETFKKKLRPTIVYLHGGAWILGEKDQFNSKSLCYHFATHDYCAVSVGYRLTSISNCSITSAFVALTVLFALFALVSNFKTKMFLMVLWLILVIIFIIVILNRPSKTFKHPCHALDCARALRFVKSNIHKWGGDPNRIILAGHSAGAHLCALLCCNERFLKHVAMSPRDLLCGICISGVYNDCTMKTSRIARNVLHESFGKCPDVHKDAFPIHHLRPGRCPPLLVLSAQRDFSLKRQAREFVGMARSHGVYVVAHCYPSTNHYSIILGWHAHNWRVLRDILHFCKERLDLQDECDQESQGYL